MTKYKYKLKFTAFFAIFIVTFLFGVNKTYAYYAYDSSLTYGPTKTSGPSSGFKDFLTLEIYKCNKEALEARTSEIGANNQFAGMLYTPDTSTDAGVLTLCAMEFTNGSDFSTYKVTNGSSLDPGDLFILRVAYDYIGNSGSSIWSAFGGRFSYDSNKVDAVQFGNISAMSPNATPYCFINPGQYFTTKQWYNAWSVSDCTTATYNNSSVYFLQVDGSNTAYVSQEVVYFGLKVKDDAEGGSSLPFSVLPFAATDLSYGSVPSGHDSLVDGSASIYAGANSVTLTVSGGETSTDNTLLSLNVGNGTISNDPFPFDSSAPFTPGSKTEKTYLVNVANSASTIDLSATANDVGGNVTGVTYSNGTITNDVVLDENSGDRVFSHAAYGITVGMNTFTILVQSPYGTTETYTLNVYRLSNDVTITGITATNSITLTKQSSTPSGFLALYTGNTTYDVGSTSLTASTTHQNASVSSGNGVWQLTNSGATANEKTVTVQAENCLSKYSSVPGNSCSTGNYKVSITRAAPSADASLSDLTVNGTTVTGFMYNITEYDYGDVAANVNSLTIGATLTDTAHATIVSGVGTCSLTVGDNQCKVKTLAQDGTTPGEYIINVHKLSNEIKLSTLTFTTNSVDGTLSPEFKSEYTNVTYTYTYQPSVTKITVSAEVLDLNKATIAIVNAPSGVPSSYTPSSNVATAEFNVPATSRIAIMVTAEDGTVNPYIVNFTRQTSTNNYLENLTMKYNDGNTDVNVPLTPSGSGASGTGFTSTHRTYTASVPADVTSVTLTPTKAVQYSKVTKLGDTVATTSTPDLTTGTKSNLAFGPNTVEVIVVNEAGNDNTYTITLTREKYDIKTLDALNLGSGFTTTFAPGDNNTTTVAHTYNGKVPFETTQLNLTGTKSNQYAQVSARLIDENSGSHDITLTAGEGNTFSSTVDIPTGQNTIEITVTAHDNSTKKYTIAVERTKNNDNSVDEIRVSTGSGANDYATATKDSSDDKVWHVTIPYSKTSVQPSEVAVTISSDASITKGSAVTNITTTESKPFTFTVTAEDGTAENYTLNIIRAANNEALITKVTLAIEGATSGATASCTMSSTERSCTIGVPTSTTGFIDELEKSDGATVTTDTGAIGSMHSMAATASTMTIHYEIKSEDTQTTNNYTITINRTKSSINTLSNLRVGGTQVSNFASGRNNYSNTQAGTVETVEVEATVTEIGKASVSRVTVNDTVVTVTGELANGVYTFDAPLNFGDNEVIITVQAENEQTQNYNLTINRQKRNDPLLTYIKYRTSSTGTFSGDYSEITGYVAGTGSYTLPSVAYDITSIEFIADPVDEFGSAIITSVTNENGTVTASNVPDTNGDDDNTYTASVNLSTGSNVIVITGTAHNGQTTKTYTLTINRTKNSANTFENLKVKDVDAELDEEDTTGKTYKVTLPNSATSLDTATDISVTLPAGATVSYSPTTIATLSTTALNTITMTVTSESGVGEAYTINITRTPSSVTTLTGATITVSSTETAENGSKLYCYFETSKECTLNVPTATNGFTLELAGGALDAGSTDPVVPKEYEMPASQSTIEIPITVTAENGEDTDNYKVTVNRAKSGNNNLADLAYRADEEETTPWTTVTNFTPGTTLYRVEVEGDVTELYLKATVQDTGKAKVNTDLSSAFLLQFEQNQFEIEVEAENGNKTKYYLIVYRKHKTDALLESIKVDNVFVAPFNSEVFAYSLDDVAYNKTSITVLPELHDKDEDTTAYVSYNGTTINLTNGINVDLNTGTNTVELLVTADDQTTTEKYTLVIKRAKNKSTAITGITLAGQTATYNEQDGVWEVSVDNDVDKANSSNVVVTPAPGATARDPLAQTSLVETNLDTTDTTDVTISVTAEDGTQGTVTLRVTRAKSNVATLHTLTVQGGSFNPSFVQDSATPSKYTVTIPETADKVIIAATPTDEHAVVSGTGSFTFTGNSQFAVNVASEDGSNFETYVLEVVRSTSSVNTLKSITISSGSNLAGNYEEYTLVATEDGTTEGFSPETTAYSVTIPGDISRINIEAETSDPRAQITNALTALGERDISVGSHTVTIRVQSESGAGQSYVLSITRLPKPFNLLTDLTVDGVTVDGFAPDVNDYTLDDVDNGTASLVIGGSKEDGDSSVKGFGTCDLKVGDNTCSVTVTAQDGTPNIYTISVKRKASDENRLSMLTVNGYSISPTFNADTYEYTVTVKATKTKLAANEVTAIAKDSTATVTKDAEVTLVTDQYTPYTVHVESASGKPVDYVIRVMKPKSSDATLSSLVLTNASLSGSIQKNVTEYTLYIPHGVESFTIKGVPTVETTTVTSGDGTYLLAETDYVYLYTLAEDNTTTLTYTFRIEESLSNDATLSGLMVQGYPYVGTNTIFSPAITTYSIGDIDFSVDKLTVLATATNTTSTIKYYVNGTLQDNNVVSIPPGTGSGSITVNVTAADGVTPKTYNISYNKVYSTNAYLAYMGTDVGTFTTNFIKTNTQYILLVDESVEEVNFLLYTESDNAYMSINDGAAVGGTEATPYTYKMTGIETGDNPLTILVKPQDEDAASKTYSVIVRKAEPAANSDSSLESLSVDDYPFVSQSGYTTTTFVKDVTDYHIGTINLKVNKLKVNYETTQSGSTTSILVNGVPTTPEEGFVTIPELETNNGVVTVQVVAPNGSSTSNYNIHYIKVASDNAFLENIVVSNGTLDQDFYRETYSYIDTVDENTMSETLTITPEVSTVTITIGSGVAAQTYDKFPVVHTISGLNAGDRQIPITVTAENGNLAYYYVTIHKEGAGELITSDTYGHTIDTETGYITTISPNKTATEIKDQLDNDNTKLKIFKDDGTGHAGDELGDGELVGTGMIVKLYINDIENDSKVIVIKGDVSGDGKITVADVVRVLNHYLGKNFVSGAYLEAAEVSGDDKITVADVVRVLNHYLGKTYLTQHK